MTDNILDLNPADDTEYRSHPPGLYEGYVTGQVHKHNVNGNGFFVLDFRAEQPLSGQDMAGVNIDRTLQSEQLYSTPKSRSMLKTRLLKFGVPPASSYGEWVESIVGTRVRFKLEVKKNEQSGREFRVVTDWEAADARPGNIWG